MKYYFSYLFGLFFAFSYLSVNACKCREQEKLSLDFCKDFELIAKVKINSISPCNQIATAQCNLMEIYKGDFDKTIDIDFDCASSCQMSIEKGDIWMVYAKKTEEGKFRISLCDRNRKYFENDSLDFYRDINQMTYGEEVNFLKSNIGLKTPEMMNGNQSEVNPNAVDITQRENILGTGQSKLWMIIVSLSLFLIIYFVFKKYFK